MIYNTQLALAAIVNEIGLRSVVEQQFTITNSNSLLNKKFNEILVKDTKLGVTSLWDVSNTKVF